MLAPSIIRPKEPYRFPLYSQKLWMQRYDIVPTRSTILHRPEDYAAWTNVSDEQFRHFMDALGYGDEIAIQALVRISFERRRNTFSPVTDTFNSGSGNEVIPSGAGHVTITGDGGGGGGGRSTTNTSFDSQGGGGSGRSIISNRIVLSGEWGTNLAYAVGAGAAGQTVAGGAPTTGGNTTVTGTLNGGAINLAANGSVTGAGGTASGGDTNTSGSNGVVGDLSTDSGAGGAGAGGGTGGSGVGTRGAGGGGSASGNNGSAGGTNGGAGAAGKLVFAWVA